MDGKTELQIVCVKMWFPEVSWFSACLFDRNKSFYLIRKAFTSYSHPEVLFSLLVD